VEKRGARLVSAERVCVKAAPKSPALASRAFFRPMDVLGLGHWRLQIGFLILMGGGGSRRLQSEGNGNVVRFAPIAADSPRDDGVDKPGLKVVSSSPVSNGLAPCPE
jgi:hypothetical protein